MVCLLVNTRGGFEDTKKSKAKAKDSPSEDKPSRGQGQECSRPRPRTKDTGASVLRKKKYLEEKISGDLLKRKSKRSLQIFLEVSGVFLHNFKNEQIPTIVGTDANARHTLGVAREGTQGARPPPN